MGFSFVTWGVQRRVFRIVLPHFILAILFFCRPASAANENPHDHSDGLYPYLPSLIQIPERTVADQILPGFVELAVATQAIAEDIYGPQSLLSQIPALRQILHGHPGYWPELVGKLSDRHFVRLLGPDLPSLTSGSVVLGEINGGNSGSHEFLQFMMREFDAHPEWGDAPHDRDLYLRWAAHLRTLFRHTHPAKADEPVIVWADESSWQTEPIEVKTPDGGSKLVKPPFSVSKKFLDHYRQQIELAGMHFISLVDDRGRLFVQDGILYTNRNGEKLKVDVLITMADMESIDWQHTPQVDRNIAAHRPDLNDVALLTGIPGLIQAWLAQKNGGFIWDGPPKILTRSKAWPLLFSEFVKLQKGNAPLLPDNGTRLFQKPDGSLDSELIGQVGENLALYVLKPVTGDSGTGMLIAADPNLTDEARSTEWQKIGDRLAANPMSYVLQPFTLFQTVGVKSDSGDGQQRLFDIRPFALVSGSGPSFRMTAARHFFVRLAPPGGLKITLKHGGAYAIGVPANVDEVRAGGHLVPIGIPQISHSHYVESVDSDAIRELSENRALTLARLLRDLTLSESDRGRQLRASHDLQGAFERHPEFDPMQFARVHRVFPPVFLSNTLVGNNDSATHSAQSLTRLSHFNRDGSMLLREWRRNNATANEALRELFAKLRGLRESGSQNLQAGSASIVCLIDGIALGDRFELLSEKFFQEFNVRLIDSSSLSDRTFLVKEKRLYYSASNDDRSVDILVFMSGEKNGSTIQLPDYSEVAESGNILIVNEPQTGLLWDEAFHATVSEIEDLHRQPKLHQISEASTEVAPNHTAENHMFLGYHTVLSNLQVVTVDLATPASPPEILTGMRFVSAIGVDDWSQQVHVPTFYVPVQQCGRSLAQLSRG